MADTVFPYKEKLSKMLADRDLAALSFLLNTIDTSIISASDDVSEKIVHAVSDVINAYARTLCIPTDPGFQIL